MPGTRGRRPGVIDPRRPRQATGESPEGMRTRAPTVLIMLVTMTFYAWLTWPLWYALWAWLCGAPCGAQVVQQ
jgi:hypothetical protein